MAEPRYRPTKSQHVFFTKVRRGRNWYTRLPRNERGVRLYERQPSYEAAKARAHGAYGTGGGSVPISTSVTVKQVADAWRADQAPRLKPRTVETYEDVIRRQILPTLGRKRARDLNRLAIRRWLDGLRRADGGELADGTKRLALSVLEALLTHAVVMGVIPSRPEVPRADKPKAPAANERILTEGEEECLLAAFGRRSWMVGIVQVALGQALRLGEVCGLEWGDVDFDAGEIVVRHNADRNGRVGTPKGGSAKAIPLMPRARKVLAELRMAQGRPEDGPVFLNGKGERRNRRDLQRAMTEAARRAGLEDVSLHTLRHTAISRLANDPRVPLVFVRDYARHSSLMITNRYVHQVVDAEVAALAAEVVG